MPVVVKGGSGAGISMGLQKSGGCKRATPYLWAYWGPLHCSRKPVGLGREGFASSAKEILSRREGKPTCAEWRLCAGLGSQAVGGSAVQHPGMHAGLSL